MKKKNKRPKTQQKRQPPRVQINVNFPKKLYWGIQAIAAMENWTVSKTVVEIVAQVLDPEHQIVK